MSDLVIHNVATGEIIEREMTEQELAQIDLAKQDSELRLELAQQAAAKKAALLEKLGITEDEAKLLLS
jgi:hypothetical protein